LAIADYQDGRILPDRLTRKSHRQYLEYAERMLRVYRTGIGRTRRELHRAIWTILADEPDCPQRRIDALAKLLDDAATYHRDTRGRAASLRRQVFRQSAAMHPLVRRADRLFEHEEADAKVQIAARLGRTWKEIDEELFADVMEFHRLASFEGYADGPALLARYNVAQVQAALYRAASLTVWARDDFKTIVRYAKLARLMHTITPGGQGGYRFHFDGPASVLRETRRYGVAMARFLPALIACRGWRMHALIRSRRGHLLGLDLSARDGLTSHLPPPDSFDSSLEQSFAEKWGPEKREGWLMVREGEILHRGQKVFLPDFLFRHDDGRTVLLEIVGFWTPEYLQAKLETLRVFSDQRILLAVARPAREAFADLPPTAIPFKTSLAVKEVLERLEGLGGSARSPLPPGEG
jgi:predicted nuclease of restriction endonuclease-like RecB superfamily